MRCLAGSRRITALRSFRGSRGREVATGIDGFEDPQRRVLAATYGGVRVMNLYVPNGQSVESDKYVYKLEWLAALHAQLAGEGESVPASRDSGGLQHRTG